MAKRRVNKRSSGRVSRGRLRRVLAYGVAVWFVWSIGSVVALRFLNPPTTAFIVADRVRAAFAAPRDYRFQQRWVDWAQISRSAKLAVIASEDQRFAEHFGFDFLQIERALSERDRGVSVRGASTISQQTAKNLFLWGGQSWVRKGLEAYFTLLIEACWPKTRILEVYLNIAEFGQGVWGVGAASERYFKQTPARLNRSQSALLAAVLPNPTLLRVTAPSKYVRARQAWILKQMNALGGETAMAKLD
jgi:monofunctional biosynthetic peptidoglycan transglycosylase